MQYFFRDALPGFVRARLSPDGVLGLHLTIGAVIFLLAGFVFGHIAEDVVTADRMVTLDIQLSTWFRAHARPLLTTFFLGLAELHSTPGVIVLSLFFAAWLTREKLWDWVVLLVVSVPIGMLLNVLLKNAFQRSRPVLIDPILTLATYSFPSGHTTAATLLYSVLAAYVISITRRRARRVLVVVVAAGMVALVGLSRIYLGVHYLSDVLAAVASSTVWLAVTFTAVATWRRRQMTKALKLAVDA